ncbi:MAG: hydrogenase maturation nickel metallochaperone HypA [Vulcanibacillus sp.]
MHEIALMGDILNLIKEDIKDSDIKKVTKIELIVGDLSNALPDALVMALDIYKTQGIDFLDKETELVIIREKAKALCTLCNLEYDVDYKISICPQCDMPSGKIVKGETFKISSYNCE